MVHDVLVVGAGLTGLLFAKELALKGYRVQVFEKRRLDDEDLLGTPKKNRSMSMDISARGLKALARLELDEKVLALSMPMTNKVFHLKDSDEAILPYGRSDHDIIWAISRAYLHEVLLKACQNEPAITFHSGQEIIAIEEKESEGRIVIKNHAATFAGDILVGADGLNSVVRSYIRKAYPDDFSDVDLGLGYKELSIQATLGAGLIGNATHIWPRKGSLMMVAQPNLDSSYQVALILPLKGDGASLASITTPACLRKLFVREWPEVLPRMPYFEEEYFNNPSGHLKAVKSGRLTMNDRILLIGDAAHAMVPFFGQGANSGFEDCTIFFECLNDAQHVWKDALSLYQHRRVASANAIVDLSLTNYPELTHNVDIKQHLLKRQIARKISILSEQFLPFSDMVYFGHVPYSYVENIKRIQESMLERISEKIVKIDDISMEFIAKEIGDYEARVKGIMR